MHPRLLLLTTSVLPDTWTQELTRTMRTDDLDCALGLRYRQSRGGRPWARPEALQAHIHAARCQAKPTLNGSAGEAQQSEADLRIRGPIGPDPPSLLRAAMSHLCALASLQLVETDSVQNLRPGTWVLLCTPEHPMAISGVRVRLSSPDDISLLRSVASNTSLSVGGDMVAVEVATPMTLAIPGRQSGPSSRSRARR